MLSAGQMLGADDWSGGPDLTSQRYEEAEQARKWFYDGLITKTERETLSRRSAYAKTASDITTSMALFTLRTLNSKNIDKNGAEYKALRKKIFAAKNIMALNTVSIEISKI